MNIRICNAFEWKCRWNENDVAVECVLTHAHRSMWWLIFRLAHVSSLLIHCLCLANGCCFAVHSQRYAPHIHENNIRNSKLPQSEKNKQEREFVWKKNSIPRWFFSTQQLNGKTTRRNVNHKISIGLRALHFAWDAVCIGSDVKTIRKNITSSDDWLWEKDRAQIYEPSIP